MTTFVQSYPVYINLKEYVDINEVKWNTCQYTQIILMKYKSINGTYVNKCWYKRSKNVSKTVFDIIKLISKRDILAHSMSGHQHFGK